MHTCEVLGARHFVWSLAAVKLEMAGPVGVILMMYVCVGMAKRDASPLIYRGFPTGAFT